MKIYFFKITFCFAITFFHKITYFFAQTGYKLGFFSELLFLTVSQPEDLRISVLTTLCWMFWIDRYLVSLHRFVSYVIDFVWHYFVEFIYFVLRIYDPCLTFNYFCIFASLITVFEQAREPFEWNFRYYIHNDTLNQNIFRQKLWTK